VDALRAEGLDLDVVDQMKDLALAGDDAECRAGKPDVMTAFEPSAPSTKVNVVLCSYKILEQCNPWPHVSNCHISISQLFSL